MEADVVVEGNVDAEDVAALDAPKIMAALTLQLDAEGNLSTAFGSELTADMHAAVAEHMLRKALQACDDEKFSRFLSTALEMKQLIQTPNGQGKRNGMLRKMGLGR